MTRARISVLLVLVALLAWTARTTTTDTVLVAKGATWKYYDKGALPGAGWNTLAFDDALWASGPA